MVGKPGRHRFRRWSGITGAIAALLLVGVGCTGVPNQAVLAEGITAELQTLPGVDTVTGGYANGMTTGVSYNVRVTFVPEATADQLDAFVELYFSRVAEPALDEHTSSLHARIDDASIAFFSGRERPDPPGELFRRWYTLTRTLDGPLRWAITADSNLIEYSPADGIVATIDQLRTVAPDLTDDVIWKIRQNHTTVTMRRGYLSPPVAALAGTFADSRRQWTIDADTVADPALTMAVWKADSEPLEPTARADLQAIAALGTPVQYTLKVSGGPHLQVFVGGCDPGGDGLQQQLNAEFGTC